MRTRIAGALVLVLSLFGPAGVRAQELQPQQALPPTGQSQGPATPSPAELGVSLEHIKFALGQAQSRQLKFDSEPPTFRIQIIEKQKAWMLPGFSESLKIPWQPVPGGGSGYDEIMKMITPPEAQPFGAFTSRELPQAIAEAYVMALMMYGLKQAVRSIRTSYHERTESDARNQVMREFEEFLRTHPDAPRPAWWTGAIKQ